jgi:hypothetical protein
MIKKILFWLLLMTGTVNATPLLELGTSTNYCQARCYIKIPFTITGYESTRNIGMVYCEVDAEVTSIMVAYGGEIRTRILHQSPIGVFKNTTGVIKGEVEVDTGIGKIYFKDAKIKTANCHL